MAKRPHYDTYSDLALALRRRAQRDSLPCWICRRPIDFTADWRHPQSYTYDHVTPINAGGDPRGPGRPAHRGCNARAGDRSRTRATADVTNTSRDWLSGPPKVSSQGQETH